MDSMMYAFELDEMIFIHPDNHNDILSDRNRNLLFDLDIIYFCKFEKYKTIFDILINKLKININHQDNAGQTPIMFLLYRSDFNHINLDYIYSALRLFLESDCNLELRDKHNKTVYDYARKADDEYQTRFCDILKNSYSLSKEPVDY
jgi:hypothetical protein